MARLIYLFDTNAISDMIEQNPVVNTRIRQVQTASAICLCMPVHYEVKRGFIYNNSSRKLALYEQQIRPRFEWIQIETEDVEQAANFWAFARRNGKQLSDIDLLIAAIAVRLNAVIISADQDFDALPIKRENWRE